MRGTTAFAGDRVMGLLSSFSQDAMRRRRHKFFMELLGPLTRPLRILDVGGTRDYWADVGFAPDLAIEIVLLNAFDQNVAPPFYSVVGDACDLLRYADKQFDVVFSNSVLGHVGTFTAQLRMANEVSRVGARFFVQTPNQGFPIDWRTRLPFFHFLSPEAQAWCFEHFSVGTYRHASSHAEAMHWATRVRNIRRSELDTLFPQASIVPETVLGFSKSFMIHNFS